jgi:peptidyl-prolyl cis-trans isomerase C
MSPRRRFFFTLCLASAAAVHQKSFGAHQDSRLQSVVATVGSSNITVLAMERRLRLVPDFQLAGFGASPGEVQRNFLEQVMIRDALFAQGAEARKLDQTTPARERIDQALRTARIDLLKAETVVTPAEVAAFYAENRARFDAPERIAVLRILCAARDEAVRVLSEAKANGGPQRWTELARERSIDKATSLRGGALGFLAKDGSSSEPSVRVDPALFVAASRVKDGEFVPEPVEEGNAYAVIWRRGSTPAVHRTLEQETSSIRQVLVRRKLEEGTRNVVERLRAEQNVESHPELVEMIDVEPNGDVGARKRPGLAPRKPARPPQPSATPRGLR